MAETAAEEKAHIVELLLSLAERAQEIVSATLREFETPPSAAPTLRILATSDEPVTPRDLARRLQRDPSTVSLIADKLAQAGLIARQPHPRDGRKRVLALTDRGHLLWSTLRERLHEAAFFAGVSAGERHVLRDLLSRMSGGGNA